MTSRRARRFLVSLVLSIAGAGVAVGAPSPVRAEATADQRAAAQVLFDEARRLMAKKEYADACPKLQESQKLDPGLGTLLNLAECQALTGKTATAWTNFLDAAYQAKAAGNTKRENTARARVAALEPRLSRITILAVMSDKLEVKRDGSVVSSSLIGSAVPVDPGEHVVSASAPGKKPWETRIVVKPEGHQVTVSVPSLEEAVPPPPEVKPPPEAVKPPPPPPPEVKPPPEAKPPPPPPPEVKPPPQTSAGKGPRVAGAVLTVLGLGGLGVATYFTVMTRRRLDASNGPGGCVNNLCPPIAFNERNDARLYGNVATGAFVGGGAVTLTGVAFLVAAGEIKDKALRAQVAQIVPAVAAGPGRGATLGWTGRF